MGRRIDDELAKRLYLEEGLTTIAIAERLGFSDVGIGKALSRLGVPRHPRTFWPKTSGRPRSDVVARFESKCRICHTELAKRELPRPGEAGYCDGCLRKNQTTLAQHGGV